MTPTDPGSQVNTHTPSEVARIVGVSVRLVHKWIDTGDLRATNYGGGEVVRWRITADDLDSFLQARRNTRRPDGDAA